MGRPSKGDIFRAPARMNRAQLDFVRSMSDTSHADKAARRRELVAALQDQWFADLMRLYPQALQAIETALGPSAAAGTRTATAKWLFEQRRLMAGEEREAEAARAQAETSDKPASEMTLDELNASIARLERLAAAERADEAEIVPESSIFD